METIIIEKKGKDDKNFTDLKWVMNARCTDKARQNICGVFVDNGLIIATDGHRMHMIYSEIEIDNGNYEVISANQKQIVLRKQDNPYPDYWRVFPKWKPTKTVFCNGDDQTLFRTVYHDFADDVSYPTDQLHDVYMDHSEVSICKDEKQFSPLCLYDNDRRAALIMPLKIQ
jgi:hypothetical protein